MPKRKTTRRWNGAGDGLVHGYQTWLLINPPQRILERETFCRLEVPVDAHGIWCRHPITCVGCLANLPRPVNALLVSMNAPMYIGEMPDV